VNRSEKWAIFIHGCFWHAHQKCPLWKIPKSNRAFWRAKFHSNIERDKRKLNELKKLGYSVLILWGCELRDEAKARGKILRFVQRVHETQRNNGKAIQAVSCVGSQSSAFDQSFLRQTHPNESSEKSGTIRVADLFCGCGGLSLGTQEACSALGYRFESLLAIDNEASSLEVYKTNFNPSFAYEKDIWEIIDGERGGRLTVNEKALLEKIAQIDVLLAGPPCQGHSDLNNHTRRNDKRNGLYERVGRFAEIAHPQNILIENVPNVVLSHDHALDRTSDYLLESGYRIDTGVVDLSELSVPQRRRRHVLIASLGKSISVKDVIDKHRISRMREVKWAIGDLEQEQPMNIFTASGKHSRDNLKRIAYLFKYDLYDLPDRFRPPCHRNGHTYKSMYGRMKYDEPAQTITSGFGCPGQGRFIHPTQPRALTPHEAARLQFFPDFFDFSSAKTRAALANMIGNAVPMKLSYVFCLEFLS